MSKTLKCLDEVESQINSANSLLVEQLKIGETNEITWSARETERLSTFGSNSKSIQNDNSLRLYV